jgi:hemin uptake protein HemP
MKDALMHETGDCGLMGSEGPKGARSEAAGPPRGEGPVRIDLVELLRGGREAIIVHNGADYRLRVTANGKLILTK